MTGVTYPQTAVERASRIWRCSAQITRHVLRARGVTGPLKRLDEFASDWRGHAVPRGLAIMAVELSQAGMAPDEIKARLRPALDGIIDAVCMPQQSGGPSAA